MKKSKFTKAQIVFALPASRGRRRGRGSLSQARISETTFYNWMKKYSGRAQWNCAGCARWRSERAVEADRGRPDARQTDVPGRVKKALSAGSPASSEHAPGGVSGLGTACLRDGLFAAHGLPLRGPAETLHTSSIHDSYHRSYKDSVRYEHRHLSLPILGGPSTVNLFSIDARQEISCKSINILPWD